MKPRNLVIAAFSIFTILASQSYGQGCVAIRGMACGSANANLMKGEFLLQPNFRYFESYRHFRGKHEETLRVDEGTQVINDSYFIDLVVNYGITDRLFATLILPYSSHKRSSMYEHGGNPPNGLGERHTTSSSGIGDIRMGLGYWLMDPAKLYNFNYAIGLGMKLPTGNTEATDIFYNQGPDRDMDIETVVDQSIQLGDGGYGFTVDLQGYHSLSNHFVILSNIQYLFNVTNTNGVFVRNGRSQFSSPDQFAIRTGMMYNTPVNGLSLFLGIRLEGVPSEDIIGKSQGYRRPGYVVSAEPAITYSKNNMSLNVGLPVALIRNRTQSYQDKVRTIETGDYRHGDAAFADYLVNISLAFRLGAGHHSLEPIYYDDNGNPEG
jgi:hypothetical protein